MTEHDAAYDAHYASISKQFLDRISTTAMSLIALSDGEDEPFAAIINPGAYNFIVDSLNLDWPALDALAGLPDTYVTTATHNGLRIVVDKNIPLGEILLTDENKLIEWFDIRSLEVMEPEYINPLPEEAEDK